MVRVTTKHGVVEYPKGRGYEIGESYVHVTNYDKRKIGCVPHALVICVEVIE